MAGGIGVTPVLSMIRTLTEQGSSAPLYVMYAVQNSNFHAFDDVFKSIVTQYPNVKYHVFYSDPKSEDKQVCFLEPCFINIILFCSIFHLIVCTYFCREFTMIPKEESQLKSSKILLVITLPKLTIISVETLLFVHAPTF